MPPRLRMPIAAAAPLREPPRECPDPRMCQASHARTMPATSGWTADSVQRRWQQPTRTARNASAGTAAPCPDTAGRRRHPEGRPGATDSARPTTRRNRCQVLAAADRAAHRITPGLGWKGVLTPRAQSGHARPPIPLMGDPGARRSDVRSTCDSERPTTVTHGQSWSLDGCRDKSA
jgi:hypothetical protein